LVEVEGHQPLRSTARKTNPLWTRKRGLEKPWLLVSSWTHNVKSLKWMTYWKEHCTTGLKKGNSSSKFQLNHNGKLKLNLKQGPNLILQVKLYLRLSHISANCFRGLSPTQSAQRTVQLFTIKTLQFAVTCTLLVGTIHAVEFTREFQQGVPHSATLNCGQRVHHQDLQVQA
jgi:hypothetical protein